MFDEEDPDLVVLSPGPGRPSDFGIPETVLACVDRESANFRRLFGSAKYCRSVWRRTRYSRIIPNTARHLALTLLKIRHSLRNVPKSFEVGRYHSLFALEDRLPEQLRVTAMSEDGVIMAIEHKTKAIAAVQFHPESIMTLGSGVGLSIIENVIQSYAKSAPIEKAVPVG